MKTVHDRLDEAALDRAALHALGALEPDEEVDYEAHLAGCAACREEVSALRQVVADLGHQVESIDPEPGLRERLRQLLSAGADGVEADAGESRRPVQTWKRWAADRAASPLVLIPGGEAGWEPTGVDGVEVRRLFVDPGADRATMMVRMRAGTSYPPHRHGGVEECFVLEGDIRVGAEVMHAGDYQRAEHGSVHGVQSTEGGCVLFIISSLRDDLLDAAPPM